MVPFGLEWRKREGAECAAGSTLGLLWWLDVDAQAELSHPCWKLCSPAASWLYVLPPASLWNSVIVPVTKRWCNGPLLEWSVNATSLDPQLLCCDAHRGVNLLSRMYLWLLLVLQVRKTNKHNNMFDCFSQKDACFLCSMCLQQCSDDFEKW